jgi:hypothetical protein
MKISKQKLKQIIKEELNGTMSGMTDPTSDNLISAKIEHPMELAREHRSYQVYEALEEIHDILTRV